MTLAGVAGWYRHPSVVLFFSISVYHIYRIFRKDPARTPHSRIVDRPLGVLDTYEIDGEESYGLFLRLPSQQGLVFIDIRTDSLLEERKSHALHLFRASSELSEGLVEFRALHPEYADRDVGSIGLHARVLEQGEVFWDPEGYTVLKGLSFQKPDE